MYSQRQRIRHKINKKRIKHFKIQTLVAIVWEIKPRDEASFLVIKKSRYLLPDAPIIVLCAFREQIFDTVRVYPVPVEVVRLEELCPELLLRQLGRDVLRVLPPDGRVRLEDGLYDVRGEVVAEAVGAVSLGLDLGEEGAGDAHLLPLLGLERSGKKAFVLNNRT